MTGQLESKRSCLRYKIDNNSHDEMLWLNAIIGRVPDNDLMRTMARFLQPGSNCKILVTLSSFERHLRRVGSDNLLISKNRTI